MKNKKTAFFAIAVFAIIIALLAAASEIESIALIVKRFNENSSDRNLPIREVGFFEILFDKKSFEEDIEEPLNENVADPLEENVEQSLEEDVVEPLEKYDEDSLEEKCEVSLEENVPLQEGLKTPCSIVDAVIADGGKYLILRLDGLAQLSVYDVQKEKIVHVFNLQFEDFLYTAGGKVVLVYYPKRNMFHTWGLETFQELENKHNPNGWYVSRIIMGHSNDQLALIRDSRGKERHDFKDTYLLDVNTLKKVPIRENLPNAPDNILFESLIYHRVGFLSEWETDSSTIGNWEIRLSRGGWSSFTDYYSNGYIAVGDDGLIYRESGQIYTIQLAKLAEIPGTRLIPGIGGYLYLGIASDGAMQVYMSGSTTPLGSVGIFPGFEDPEAHNENLPLNTEKSFAFNRHIFFNPNLGYIIIIPPENDRIIQRDFDLQQMLENVESDYLVVASLPDSDVVAGKPWQYQIETMTNGKDVTFTLQFGPEGMVIDENGKMYWNVPGEPIRSTEKVIVLIENENDSVTYHTFELLLETTE